jgi:hypothetical protein
MERTMEEAAKHTLTARVGDRVKFSEERLSYTVRARSPRFLVCTKPFSPRKTVIYTVVDLREGVRGTENLIFGAGAETQEQCDEMLRRLEGADTELGFPTEVSRRNRVALNVDRVTPAKAAGEQQ